MFSHQSEFAMSWLSMSRDNTSKSSALPNIYARCTGTDIYINSASIPQEPFCSAWSFLQMLLCPLSTDRSLDHKISSTYPFFFPLTLPELDTDVTSDLNQSDQYSEVSHSSASQFWRGRLWWLCGGFVNMGVSIFSVVWLQNYIWITIRFHQMWRVLLQKKR